MAQSKVEELLGRRCSYGKYQDMIRTGELIVEVVKMRKDGSPLAVDVRLNPKEGVCAC